MAVTCAKTNSPRTQTTINVLVNVVSFEVVEIFITPFSLVFHFENASVLFLLLLLSKQLRHLCLQKIAQPLRVLWRRAAGSRPEWP